MKTEKRECPHCHGSLERYEDPLAIKLIADASTTAYEKGIRDAAEEIRTQTEKAFDGTTHMNSYGEGVKKGMKESVTIALSLLTKPKDKE